MNPFELKPKKLENYISSNSSLALKAYDKHQVSPYTKVRIILASGTEFEANWYSHNMQRMTYNNDLRRELAMIRRIEQQQHKKLASLKPIDETILETTLTYEQVAVDLTAMLAKREKNANESRIRYLKKMIETAKVIKVEKKADAVCLFDTVTYYVEEDEEEETRQLVTTLRQDVLKGYLSKESPLGKALMGRKVGDRVLVRVNDNYSYYVEIRNIKKGHDDENIPISSY